MKFFDILCSSASFVFLISQYFQFHFDLHRSDFANSSRTDLVASQVNFYYPKSLQEVFSLIMSLAQINCLIFLVYYGYRTAWYSTGVLFFGSIFLSATLYALVKSKPVPRKLLTILAFIIVPVSNLALWFLL